MVSIHLHTTKSESKKKANWSLSKTPETPPAKQTTKDDFSKGFFLIIYNQLFQDQVESTTMEQWKREMHAFETEFPLDR